MLGLVGGAPGKTPRVAESSAHWCASFMTYIATLNTTSMSKTSSEVDNNSRHALNRRKNFAAYLIAASRRLFYF